MSSWKLQQNYTKHKNEMSVWSRMTSPMEGEADAGPLPQLLFTLPFRKGSLASLELSFSRELLLPAPTHRYVLPRLASHLVAGDLNSNTSLTHLPSSPTYTLMDTFLCSLLFLQIYFSLRVAGSLSRCHEIFWCVRLPKFICPPLGVYVGCSQFELL